MGEQREKELDQSKPFIELEKKIASAGWGLLFIWVGISYLLKFDVGIILLGVGIITLVGQLYRKLAGIKFDGFWIMAGSIFVLGGVWEIFRSKSSLVPFLLIVVGIILLISSGILKKTK